MPPPVPAPPAGSVRAGTGPTQTRPTQPVTTQPVPGPSVPTTAGEAGSDDAGVPALGVRGVTRRFGTRLALDGVDLVVRAGSVHGLLGPNGAGKTTLLSVVLGLVRPDAGQVRLLGAAPGRWPEVLPARVAGFVSRPRMYPYLTGRENLELAAALDGTGTDGAGADGADVDRVLATVGLADPADQPVAGWSTGMSQRLGIAAALLRSPAVVVLDEPTTGLDPAGMRDLHRVLRELTDAGTAVLLSSHDLTEVADVCDEVTVMRGGRVVYRAATARLLADAPDPVHLLHTSDDRAVLAAAGSDADVLVRAAAEGGLTVQADVERLDRWVVGLGRAGIAVRSMRLEVPPLAALFFRLVEGDPVPTGGTGDDAAASDRTLTGRDTEPLPAHPPDPSDPTGGGPAPHRSRVGVGTVFGRELARLAARRVPRAVLAVCLVAPFLFVGLLSAQSAVPSDTLFGRWVHESGFALPLVVLSFAAQWAIPALTAVVAGDVFATEDGHGTWPLLLTRGAGRGALFTAKVLLAGLWSVVVVVVLGLASTAAGLLVVGHRPLVSLSGIPLGDGAAGRLVAAAWALALLPALGFAALGVLTSVVSRRTTVGVAVPVLLGLVMELLLLASLPRVVRDLLLSGGFGAWHGLAVSPSFTGPVTLVPVVAAGWVLACLVPAWLVFRRRDVAVRT